MTNPGTWTRHVALVLGAALALTGCGSDRNAPVEEVATAFYQAVAAEDGTTACRLLAPATAEELERSAGKPCAQAILEEDVPQSARAEEVEVYGTAGEVRTATDTAFLAKFRRGWRVVAVACTPSADRPHDCAVAGG